MKHIGAWNLAMAVVFGLALGAHAQTNSWTNAGGGKWEEPGNWSLNAPPFASQSAILITNGTPAVGSKTILLDSTTAGLIVTMTISNLVLSGQAGTTNTVQLMNTTATALRIVNALTVGSNGVLFATNSTIHVDTSMVGRTNIVNGLITITGAAVFIATNSTTLLGSTNGASGRVDIRGGSMLCSNLALGLATNSVGVVGIVNGQLSTATNITFVISRFGKGELTASNSTVRLRGVIVGGAAGGNGTLTLVNSTNILSDLMIIGGTGSTGSVWITDGSVVTNTSAANIGSVGDGFLNVSNSSVFLRGLTVGSFGRGTATFMDSSITSDGMFVIGSVSGSTGTVTVIGGQLTTITNVFLIGNGGDARLTASNCTLQGGNTYISVSAGGTLTLLNADMTALFGTYIGLISTGTVWVGGGTFRMTREAYLGLGGSGRLILSNGTLVASNLFVSTVASNRGTLTIAGGAAHFSTGLIIGDCASNGIGQVSVAGGLLAITNATQTAVLDVSGGTFTISSGTLIVDKLVMTNACGRFIRTGGILSITTTNLDPNLSAVGDGIPNGWKQQYGLDPFDSTIANADSDGDGFTNLHEFLAGTDPTNSASAFRILSVSRTNVCLLPPCNAAFIAWMTAPNKTNALQRAPGDNYTTNNFVDIFSVTNTIGTVTNYIDAGPGATFPSRFYRVRLVP